jgi:hypothetical protein
MERIYEAQLNELLNFFPCVAIIGVRQCGKTTLLQNLPEQWQMYDMEKASDFDMVSRDPELFFRLHPVHIALDEAQLLPEIFPVLRVAIDADRNTSGRFIITGSSSPDLISAISESLAGRVAIIEMAPFTYAEAHHQPVSGISQGIAQGAALSNYLSLVPPKDELQAIHRYWYRGGYPEPWVKDTERFTSLWMQNYVKTYLERDIIRLFPGIARQKYKLFLQMLCHLSGTVINYSDVARALGISPPTARDYFEIAHGTFIWRKIPPYERNAQKRIVKHPKGYIRDSGLLHHLLHLTNQEDILAHPSLGRSWEAMVIENLLRELSALGVSHEYFYYRTSGGAEVDLVLEGDFGLIPIEIKYGQNVSPHGLRSLGDFVKERNCPYGLVINNDERIRHYDKNIIGIPFGAKLPENR